MRKKIHNYWIEQGKPNLVRFLLFITKGEILYLIMAAIITVTIITWTIMSLHNLSDVIELSTFSAVVLEGALMAFVGILRVTILNYTEDPSKLTNDYDGLVKRYSSENNFVWKRNGNEVSVIPVVHVAWIYDRELVIEDHPESEYDLPDIIDKHYEELFTTHLTSKLYNNINIRVDDWYADDAAGQFRMVTGRTSFYNSLVTNRTMDYKLENGISVRELLECGPLVHPLKYSSLSNHLGFNGFVESSDGEIMFVYRKKNVSIGKRTYGDSIGASLKTKYALNERFEFTKEGLQDGIVREIEDELGISEDQLITWDAHEKGTLGPVKLIAAYRDMLEGGKPQLMFYARTSMSKAAIEKSFQAKNSGIAKSKSNFSRTKNEKEMETDGNELHWIRREDMKNCYVSSEKVIHQEFILPMVPSASACVAMFIQYLKRAEGASDFGMSVKERFLRGKNGDDITCEDAVFCGKRFTAVIDGVTAKGPRLYEGRTSGRLAADILLRTFARLDHAKEKEAKSAQQILSTLDHALREEMQRRSVEDETAAGLRTAAGGTVRGGTAGNTAPEEIHTADGAAVPSEGADTDIELSLESVEISVSTEDWLRASVVYYDRLRKEVVCYGDCKCRIDDAVYDHRKISDIELSAKRAEILQQALAQGASVDDLRDSDPGRAAILSQLAEQFQFENKAGERGYPVLNGQGIAPEMISVYPVSVGQKIILCSDGYPEVCETLEESEAALRQILAEDPLMIGRYKGTKGCASGAESFDDRAWIRI